MLRTEHNPPDPDGWDPLVLRVSGLLAALCGLDRETAFGLCSANALAKAAFGSYPLEQVLQLMLIDLELSLSESQLAKLARKLASELDGSEQLHRP